MGPFDLLRVPFGFAQDRSTEGAVSEFERVRFLRKVVSGQKESNH